MKRSLTFVVAALLAASIQSPATAAEKWQAGNGRGPCSGWFSDVKPTMGNVEVARRVELTIRCADRIWPIDLDYALAIAERESGMWPWALNPSSGCAGIYQHIQPAWQGRVQEYIHKDWYSKWRWRIGISVFDMRANVLVAIQMMYHSGYGDWAL